MSRGALKDQRFFFKVDCIMKVDFFVLQTQVLQSIKSWTRRDPRQRGQTDSIKVQYCYW